MRFLSHESLRVVLLNTDIFAGVNGWLVSHDAPKEAIDFMKVWLGKDIQTKLAAAWPSPLVPSLPNRRRGRSKTPGPNIGFRRDQPCCPLLEVAPGTIVNYGRRAA